MTVLVLTPTYTLTHALYITPCLECDMCADRVMREKAMLYSNDADGGAITVTSEFCNAEDLLKKS